MALLEQAPALVGVIIGALGSYLTASLTERSQWRRAQAERWTDKRFEVYIQYANILKKKIRIATRLAAHHGLKSVSDPLEPEEGLQLLVEIESQRQTAWEAVLLVGAAEAVMAARQWHEAVWVAELWARGLKEDQDGWKAVVQRVSQTRDVFYETARRDLGIEGPPPPPSNWLRDLQLGQQSDSV